MTKAQATQNDLVIDDVLVTRFKAACTEHYQRGGPRVCQKARATFFADLKAQYGMEQVKPHWPDLFIQLDLWEVEVFTNGKIV